MRRNKATRKDGSDSATRKSLNSKPQELRNSNDRGIITKAKQLKQPEAVSNYTKVGHSPVQKRRPTPRDNSIEDDSGEYLSGGQQNFYQANNREKISINHEDVDDEEDQQSALLNDYYASLTAQQQKLLQAKTPVVYNLQKDEKQFSHRDRDEPAPLTDKQLRAQHHYVGRRDENLRNNNDMVETEGSPKNSATAEPLQTDEIQNTIDQNQLELIAQIREQAADESNLAVEQQALGAAYQQQNNMLNDMTNQDILS